MGFGLLLTAANVTSGGLGYVFQVLMGRMLEPGEFALFSAIVSLSVVLTSPVSAIFTVLSRNITRALANNDEKFIYKSYGNIRKVCFVSALILGVVLMLLHGQVSVFVKNSDEIQVLLLVGLVTASALGMMNNSYLQATQNFSWLAGIGISTVVLKIFVATILVFVGLGVNGALGGALISAAMAYWIVSNHFANKYKCLSVESQVIPSVVFDFNRLMPVLIANIAMAVMMQLDVVLVNNYFESEVSGMYAAAATLGKAVLYLPGGLVLALFPMVAEAQAKNNKFSNYVLTASFVTFVVCSIAVAVYWLFGDWITNALYGDKYGGISTVLKYYSLAMLPMALLIVAEYFLMAIGKVVYAWLSLLFAPLQIGLIVIYHQSLFDVLMIVGMCGLLLLLSGYLFMFKLLRPIN